METSKNQSDGRRARSDRTRAAVAEAMLWCLEAGMLRPTAKEVAERAGVSTRAVFRHFENMEVLFEQVVELQIGRVVPQLPPVTSEGSLAVRIEAFVDRTVGAYEVVAPVRRAALLAEPFSEVIREGLQRTRSATRRQLRRVFADELGAFREPERRERVAALRASLSFGHWDELRRHEKLSDVAVRRVLRDRVASLMRS